MVPLLLTKSRPRSSAFTVLAGGVAIYAAFAIGYQHFLKPAVNNSPPKAAAQYFAIPAGIPTEEALPATASRNQTLPPSGAARERTSSGHMRFVSGKPAKAPDAEEKPAAAEPKRAAKHREPSGREHRSSREVAFRPFPFFRPFF
jgi:hypothetical protein